jgi:hypothetical protein
MNAGKPHVDPPGSDHCLKGPGRAVKRKDGRHLPSRLTSGFGSGFRKLFTIATRPETTTRFTLPDSLSTLNRRPADFAMSRGEEPVNRL